MKSVRWLFLVVLMSVATVSFAGDIQILCEPGLRVYLDEGLIGTSSAREDGLFLMNVKAGVHTIRVEKDGFLPQMFQVEVSNTPMEVTVDEFTPKPVSTRATSTFGGTIKQLAGNLIVTSAPQNCMVEVDGKPHEKTSPQLTIEGLVAGTHAITFKKEGYETVEGVIRLRPGSESTIRGNFNTGKIETVFDGKGSLRVISKPQHITVRIGGQVKEKIHPIFNLRYLPAGEHLLILTIDGRQLHKSITIEDERRTVVEVSFMHGDTPFI
ncbi:MAG: PEGA domain-containing protein, partial [bacterium]|nr:PEGA domain-containing protein [bacterium]